MKKYVREQTKINELQQAKVCRRCRLLKPFADFNKSTQCANGLRSRCRNCEAAEAAKRKDLDPEKYAEIARRKSRKYIQRHPEKVRKQAKESRRKHATSAVMRHRRLKVKYKLTLDEWNTLFETQSRVCRICKSDEPGGKHGWSTDHCHTSGRVRGILCVQCNHLLGNAKDSERILYQAIQYLRNAGNVCAYPESIANFESA